MSEIWQDIKDYEGLYQVSTLGRVKSMSRIKSTYGGRSYNISEIIKSIKVNNKTGYSEITLNKNGKKKTFRVHRIVAETFIPNPENLPEINHEDGNKLEMV